MSRKVAVLLVCCAFWIIHPNGGFTQPVSEQEVNPEPASAVSPEEEEAVTEGPKVISMDLQDVYLKDAFRILSQQSGLNFVTSEDIKDRKVTLFFEKVPIEEALEKIVAANNLSYYREKDSNVFIVKESVAPKVATETHVYKLNYAHVTKSKLVGQAGEGEAKKVVEKLLSSYGSVFEDPRTNSLIVTDVPERFEMIEKAIQDIDSPIPQVMIEMDLLDVTLQTLKDLGIDYGDSYSLSLTGVSRSTAFPFPRRLMKEKGATTSVSLATISGSAYNATLNFLLRDSSTRYLARPRILTLNNETAQLKITADTLIGIEATIDATTGDITETPERTTTGVTLKVTPQIDEEGNITMLLEPEVIDVIASREVGATRDYYDPVTRSVQTTVKVKDGETIVLGGLLTSYEEKEVNKFPLLSKIPLLGLLFRNLDLTKIDRELVLFITPHIVKKVRFDLTSVPAEREQEVIELK